MTLETKERASNRNIRSIWNDLQARRGQKKKPPTEDKGEEEGRGEKECGGKGRDRFYSSGRSPEMQKEDSGFPGGLVKVL